MCHSVCNGHFLTEKGKKQLRGDAITNQITVTAVLKVNLDLRNSLKAYL